MIISFSCLPLTSKYDIGRSINVDPLYNFTETSVIYATGSLSSFEINSLTHPHLQFLKYSVLSILV